MLAFCTSPTEISLVLGQSDARWLSEEMSFLAQLYRSKAGSSERQFGEDDNVALASFLETAGKCQQLSVRYSRPSVAAIAGKTTALHWINPWVLRQPSNCRIELWLLLVPQPPPARPKDRLG